MSNLKAFLSLTIHNHQPVGNFDWVFQGAFERCYEPFIAMLAEHPSIKVGLHYSGPLLDWFEQNQPQFIDKLAVLVNRGQVEMLGGGYYEPILSVLPEADALGQLAMLADWIERRLGQAPRGIWLTERIWEPGLPDLLSRANVKYTLADDNHFRYAGLSEDQLAGYYLTENRGKRMAVFPIDRTLRYTIPFKQPEQTIEHLRQRSRLWPGVLLNYGDDGEKFGLWPGTHEWVYGERWLERFFTALEESADWLETITPGAALERFERVGRVYLPTASYHEMMQWALPAQAAADMAQLVDELKERGEYERMLPFIRGGFWNNFFVKYPESNRMHKRMLHVSRMLDSAGQAAPEAARHALYRSQCNCAYWHGLFGGLYLNYLRHAVYENILAAQRLLDEATGDLQGRVEVEQEDYDCCGIDELLVRSTKLCATVQPGYGGGLSEISFRPRDFCLTDVLARRYEAYHSRLSNAQSPGADQGDPQSIHDRVQVKEQGLENLLYYDWHERLCVLDHLLGEGYDLEALESASYREWGDFVNQPYEVAAVVAPQHGAAQIRLVRDGGLWIGGDCHCFTIQKSYRFFPDSADVEIGLTLINRSTQHQSINYGCEFNLTLLCGDQPDRRCEINGAADEQSSMGGRGVSPEVRRVVLIDEASGFRVKLEVDRPCELFRWPIETVSQSDGGFERTYQGSCLLFVHSFELEPDQQAQIKFKLCIEEVPK
ncbi:MAG: DUF1926 domain-containing protein [Candidatus Alcyoniella australis]|nr:DUF1926 domain-containing protein [Candidatus Alcyoniella australis]